jgi:hypothetical protein
VFSLQPTHKSAYCRQDELDSVVKSIKSKHNIVVLAPEKMGKSSFLQSVAAKLDPKFVPMIFSAESCLTLDAYVRKNLLRMLLAFPELFGTNPKDIFSLSLLDLDKRLSLFKISDAARQSLKLLLVYHHDPKSDIASVIRSLFSLSSILAAESKSVAVLMIDDADSLTYLKSGEASLSIIFGEVSKIDNTIFIFASSRRLSIDADIIELKLFSIDSVRKFVAENKLELNEAALSTLFNITQGYPFYLNFFCRIIQRSGAKDASAINAVVDDALQNELGLYYSERIKHLSPKELPILSCMAEHNVNTPSRISKLLDYSQTNVRRFLSIMEEKGFVTLKERGVFEINDPLFRRWLEKEARK